MADRAPSPQEIVDRGRRYYAEHLRARLEPDHKGEYLVLDIETGDYEVDPSELAAFERARARSPRGIFCFLRIGHRTTHRIGARLTWTPR